MHALVLALGLLAGCPRTTPDVTDTGGTDSGTADTGTSTDTGATDTADTGTADTGTPVVSPRLRAHRWRLTWSDDFDGPPPPGDPCYDASITPPQCMDRYWSHVDCDPSIDAQIADLNKCTWALYDLYNWMDWGKPLGHGIDKLDASEVSVEDGVLHLRAKPVAPITWQPGDPWPWDCGNDAGDYRLTADCPIVSGGIHSNPDYAPAGFAQKYGRFEVRAIIPNQMGSWPAHWLLPQGGDWPDDGEIDIMEAVSHDPSTVIGTFHGGAWFGETHVHHSLGRSYDPGEPRYAAEWHTYAVEWSPDEIRFFVDDVEISHVDQGQMLAGDVLSSDDASVSVGDAWPEFPVQIPDLPFYFILNTSIVPTGGFSLRDFAPVDHLIDWVRVYTACTPDDTDPACVLRTDGSADLTTHAWMNGPKWSDAYRTMHVADFDGDGAADVLLRTRSAGNATYLLRGDPSGALHHEETLTTANGMSEDAWSDAHRAGIVGDFDGDGAADLLLQGRSGTDDTFLLLADGQGGFAAPVTATTAWGMNGLAWSAVAHRIAVGDFDGDGTADLVLAPIQSTGEARVLLADGTGGFTTTIATTSFGLSATDWTGHLPVAADLDGDGYDDLILQPHASAGRTLWLRGGPSGFTHDPLDLTTSAGLSGPLWADATHRLLVGDFDGDGDDDLVLQGRTIADDTWLLLGGTDGIHSAGTLLGADGLSAAAWAGDHHVAAVGDLDGDGRSDVLLRGADASHGTLLVHGGPSGLAGTQDLTDVQGLGAPQWSDAARQGAVADFDGDGRSDVLLRGRTGDDHTWVVYLR